MATDRTQSNRAAAFVSWGNTVDRSARTANARKAAPGSLDHWIAKLDPERFADATPNQIRDAAIAMRKAHFARLGAASVAARRKAKGTRNP